MKSIGFMQLILLVLLLVLLGYSLSAAETASAKEKSRNAQVEVTAVEYWGQIQENLPVVDTSILPDDWESHVDKLFEVDPRIRTNGAEPPEQLVKVTDRKHKFPVFATICSICFLATVVTLLIVCTN